MVSAEESEPLWSSPIRGDRWFCCALLLLAFAVRLHGLTFHSLWLDEAVSIHLASYPLSEILRQGMSLQEPNPPLYHVALAVWMRVFGSGEGAVRIFSSFMGTLLLPAVYLLGRRLFSSRVGVIATLLAVFNPFLVWYSQEARMYAMVATLSLWSLYCFLRLLATPGLRWWVAYLLVTVASLYTHVYAAFLLPGQFLFLCCYVSRHRKVWWQAGLAWALGLLCFAPWVLRAWELSGTTPSWRPALTLLGMATACLEAFTVRRVPLSGWGLGGVLIVSAILSIVGLCLPYVPRRDSASLRSRRLDMRPNAFLALSLLPPLLLAYLLSFRQQIFTVYYLIVIVGPFLVALAVGLHRIAFFSRVAGLISLLLVLGPFLYGLGFNWSLAYRKEEWRAAARYVSEQASAGDAVLCHVDYARIPFVYYYEGVAPVFAPFGGPHIVEDDVASTLGALSGYDTLWLVQSHVEVADPNRIVEAWLRTHFPLVTEQYPPGVEVKGYASRYRLSQVPPSVRRVDALYDEKVRLLGYAVDGEAFSATDDTYHPPSGWIHVILYWQATVPLAEKYVAAVHLIDDAHQVWGGALERPTAAIRLYPPTAWEVGEVVRDDYDINLNPLTPEGTYHLEVSLLSSAGERLPASHEGAQMDSVLIGQVRIVSS